jgi:hypothetical protein
MRPYIIHTSLLAALLVTNVSRAEDDATNALINVARACGDLGVSANLKTDPKVVPDKAHTIFTQCLPQWQRAAVATVENEAHDKIANFRNRKDGKALLRNVDATLIRLEGEEEARLRDAMRAAAMTPAPKQR